MKRTPLILFCTALAIVLGLLLQSQISTEALPHSLRNFPSGAIDEYHFRPGTIVVQGRIDGPERTRVVQLAGRDLFANTAFVETLQPDSDGRFCASITIPHSQFLYVENRERVFAAVGDTLELTISGLPNDADRTVAGSASLCPGLVACSPFRAPCLLLKMNPTASLQSLPQQG